MDCLLKRIEMRLDNETVTQRLRVRRFSTSRHFLIAFVKIQKLRIKKLRYVMLLELRSPNGDVRTPQTDPRTISNILYGKTSQNRTYSKPFNAELIVF